MSSISTIGSFQISTEQVIDTSTGPSKTVSVGNEQVRIDSARGHAAPHFRAAQLNEFTSWLSNSSRIPTVDVADNAASSTQQTSTPSAIAPVPSSKKKFRIDAPEAKHVSRKNLPPHFPTSDYVGDEREIQRIVNQLKADGRIIGDATQADLEPTMPVAPVPLQWPDVTTRLLGSPAILNLEMNVQKLMNDNQLVVTSARPNSGGSTVAMALARQLAEHGKKTLLVDANLSNPNIARTLGIKNHPSWLEAISERKSLTENVITDQKSLISILPLTPVEKNVRWPRKIYNELAKIIDTVSWNYDVVIYDVGSTNQLLSEVTSPIVLGETTLLVSGQHDKNDFDAKIAQAGLEAAGVTNMLIIENFSSLNQAKVG